MAQPTLKDDAAGLGNAEQHATPRSGLSRREASHEERERHNPHLRTAYRADNEGKTDPSVRTGGPGQKQTSYVLDRASRRRAEDEVQGTAKTQIDTAWRYRLRVESREGPTAYPTHHRF